MRIFGIVMLKNEVDVVPSLLQDARRWADRIFVYDNGSTDGTWQLVQQLQDDVVVAWKREEIPFHNNLRARVFNAFRHEAEEGDWWCYRMDADEFYLDDPRAFLSQVPPQYHVVYRRSLNFVLTREDLDEYEFSGDFSVDRERLQYVEPRAKVEARFIRHRRRLSWKDEVGASFYKGISYPTHIRVKHYPWRSPSQIKTRLESRREFKIAKAERKGKDVAERRRVYNPQQWQDLLPSRAECVRYSGPETFNTVQLPEEKMRLVHESRLSYLAKRSLHALRILP